MEKTTLNANARAILETLKASHSHPTAQELYERVRLIRPRIGLATVYRILNQLADQGTIKALGRTSECRYDARIQRHDHAVCTECGMLLDLPEVTLPDETLSQAAQAIGITPDSYEIRIYGRCNACQKAVI